MASATTNPAGAGDVAPILLCAGGVFFSASVVLLEAGGQALHLGKRRAQLDYPVASAPLALHRHLT